VDELFEEFVMGHKIDSIEVLFTFACFYLLECWFTSSGFSGNLLFSIWSIWSPMNIQSYHTLIFILGTLNLLANIARLSLIISKLDREHHN